MGSPRWFTLCMASAVLFIVTFLFSFSGYWGLAIVTGLGGVYGTYEAFKEDGVF